MVRSGDDVSAGDENILQARASLLPVIFITRQGELPMAVSALKEGAAEFMEMIST